ncbi:hypothetical protein RclHR1_05040001 [Rhizophagus clarus]|uniref:Cyanovirin-N domain-containing protein n=1 Tax=Rhizophagus clarus TaxID=94130 RepID=A0A2Z6S2D6_9GLOM|nr:hypothetical protein RclHR1_05040001 [Rhizophagus clarus]GES87505.1 hypothetical protein GLOIN_2v1868011 [Rhizophagus clarus]
MKYFTLFGFFILSSFITTSSASPNGSELLSQTFEKRNQCKCSFAIADFNSGPVKGVVTFSQDESGCTEVAGIFSRGFNDTHASYGFKIVDECNRELFDLSNGLNITPDGCGGTNAFRHKFNINIDCNSNGFLTKTLHNNKRNCHSDNKLRKRLPNGAITTQNGQSSGYAGLTK